MISTLIFDMGGVVFALSHEKAIRRFEEIGVASARDLLNPYHQEGVFGQLEQGLISKEQFRRTLSESCGRVLTEGECRYAWMGFVDYIATASLSYIRSLREKGYRTLLLSNTNAFITEWGRSGEFDGQGNSMLRYFDRLYFSCECKLMKPSPEIFLHLLRSEGLRAGECIFVDDSKANIDAAASLGFRTLLAPDALSWPELLKASFSL